MYALLLAGSSRGRQTIMSTIQLLALDYRREGDCFANSQDVLLKASFSRHD